MPEWMKLWIEALRSGNYKQGRIALKDNIGRYCCLGVLQEQHGLETIGCAALYDSLVNKLGLRSCFGDGSFGNRALSTMNDNGSTFLEIADHLEMNWRYYVKSGLEIPA